MASDFRLPKHDQDFGLTLGHYGVPPGPYLVLPFFGPSTVRDGVGLLGNYFINPLTYVDPAAVSWGLYGLNVVSTRANLLGASNLLEGAAIDKYSFLRNAYLQRRQYQLSDGHASNNLPDYGEGAPPPNYGEPEEGAAGAAAPASGTARAAAPSAASMAPAYPNSETAAPAGASESAVPGEQYVPPARIGIGAPGLLRLH